MSKSTTHKERQEWVNRMIGELSMHNFGLPPSTEYKNTSFEKAMKFKAIQELYVRMNLYVSTNNKSSGNIQFPEAKRRIEYFFDSKTIKNNKVNLKALSKKYFINAQK